MKCFERHPIARDGMFNGAKRLKFCGLEIENSIENFLHVFWWGERPRYPSHDFDVQNPAREDARPTEFPSRDKPVFLQVARVICLFPFPLDFPRCQKFGSARG